MTVSIRYVIIVALLSTVGCTSLKQGQEPIVREPIPLTPAIWFSPSGTTGEISYQNACHQTVAMPVADLLVESVPHTLAPVFTGVTVKQQSEDFLGLDGVLEVGVGRRHIEVAVPKEQPGEYPATVTVGLEMVFLARDGAMLFTKKSEGTERGTVVVSNQSCDLGGLEALTKEAIRSAADGLAQQLAQSVQIRQYADQRDQWSPLASRSVPLPSDRPLDSAFPTVQENVEGPIVATARMIEPAQLSFRAIIRDESRNRVLEPDESLTLHIEVKNDGTSEAKDVVILVNGNSGLEQVFPQEVLVGTIQPDEIKRVSITKRVAVPKVTHTGELILNLRAGNPMASIPPSKVFSLGIKSTSDDSTPLPDVDQMPAPLPETKQSRAVIIAIGVGAFQDEHMPLMKYASHDAAVMAEYLRAIAGVPRERMRVLLDRQAVQQELEATFEQWIRSKVDAETLLYVFFSGRAVVDSHNGEVLLVPYDGTRNEPGHLYSMKKLQESVARLPIQRAIFMFDMSLDPSPGADLKTMPSPNWTSGVDEQRKDVEMWMVGNRNLQEAHVSEQGKHGLFTYQLLRGLQGLADFDRDGTVVAGELCLYARGEVARVDREQAATRQDPLCLPPVGRGAMVRIHPVAKGNNPKPTATAKQLEEPAKDPTGPVPRTTLVGP